MMDKRFELNNIVKKGTVSFWDTKKQKVLNASHSLDLLNELADENEQLKNELFETRKDYILETYADNPVRRDEKLKALEKELEE